MQPISGNNDTNSYKSIKHNLNYENDIANKKLKIIQNENNLTISDDYDSYSNKSVNNNTIKKNIHKDNEKQKQYDNNDSDLNESIKYNSNNENIKEFKKIQQISSNNDTDSYKSIKYNLNNEDDENEKIIICDETNSNNEEIDLNTKEKQENEDSETENYYKIEIPKNGSENAPLANIEYDANRQTNILNLINNEETKGEGKKFNDNDNNINNNDNNNDNNNFQEDIANVNLIDNNNNQENEAEEEEVEERYRPNHNNLNTDGDIIDNARTIQRGSNRRGAYLFYDDYESYIKEIFFLDNDERDIAIHQKSTEYFEEKIYDEMEILDEKIILKFINIKGSDNTMWSVIRKKKVTQRTQKEYFKIQNYFFAKKINNMNAANRGGTLSSIKNGGDEFIYFANIRDFVLNYRYTNPCEDWAILGQELKEKEKRYIQFIQNSFEVIDENENYVPIIIDFIFNEASNRDWTRRSFTVIKKRQPRSFYELAKHENEREELKKEFKSLILNN